MVVEISLRIPREISYALACILERVREKKYCNRLKQQFYLGELKVGNFLSVVPLKVKTN